MTLTISQRIFHGPYFDAMLIIYWGIFLQLTRQFTCLPLGRTQINILTLRLLFLYHLQADRACGSSSPRTHINIFVTSIHGQTDSHSLVSFCFVSSYVRSYVRYTYRSARKSDLLDTSNPPQAVSCVLWYETVWYYHKYRNYP
jgi:hypothetical protein